LDPTAVTKFQGETPQWTLSISLAVLLTSLKIFIGMVFRCMTAVPDLFVAYNVDMTTFGGLSMQ